MSYKMVFFLKLKIVHVSLFLKIVTIENNAHFKIFLFGILIFLAKSDFTKKKFQVLSDVRTSGFGLDADATTIIGKPLDNEEGESPFIF